jgi:hypothetical protein
MRKKVPTPPVLDVHHADFITHHVSILVASCSRERVPSITRAFGCRVSPDRCTVTLFLSVPRSTSVLRDVRAGGALAVVFSRPSTHETLQLKGADARIVVLDEDDRKGMQAYGDSLANDISQIGWREPFVSALVSALGEEAVGVAFTPSAAFVQTPGPDAGRRLEPTS